MVCSASGIVLQMNMFYTHSMFYYIVVLAREESEDIDLSIPLLVVYIDTLMLWLHKPPMCVRRHTLNLTFADRTLG